MGTRALVVAAIALVVVLAAGTALFAYSQATVGERHRDAMAALESARQHNNAVYKSLTDPALAAEIDNAQSVRAAKAAMDDYRATLGGSIRTVESQLVELKME